FFLPPVSIILMTSPIFLPPLKAAGFDLVWFGVVMTIVMETGLIHPPVGLNIFVIKNIAPDIPLGAIIRGIIPFVILMLLTVVVISAFPSIATALPDLVMGPLAHPSPHDHDRRLAVDAPAQQSRGTARSRVVACRRACEDGRRERDRRAAG